MRWILTTIAVFTIAAVAAGSPAGATPKPSCPIDENGNCMTDPYAAVYEDTETGEDTYENYGASYNCKVVHAIRTVRNVYWVTLFQYVEQVRWCWDGNTVREFTRWRWPQNMTWGMWSWDGNIDTGNCVSEYCQEQVGSYGEHARTTGQFHPNWCPFGFCGHRYPTVEIAVTGDGQWGASSSG